MRMEAGEDHSEFDSSLGVLQGAAASPVLFLFVIAAQTKRYKSRGTTADAATTTAIVMAMSS